MDDKEKENHLSSSPNKAKVKVSQQEEKWSKGNVQPKISGTARVGDPSIEWRSLLDVTGPQLPELRHVEESSAFTTMYSHIKTNSMSYKFDNVTHGYDISSTAMRPSGLRNGIRSFQAHWSVAASARPTAVMIPSPVTTNFSMSQGLVPNTILDLVKEDGNIDSEIFAPRAATWTHVVRSSHNLQVLSDIVFMWQNSLQVCDMSALYGKILFYMFIKQRFQDEAIEPIRRAHSADDNIVWVDTKADISLATFEKQINEGQVVLCSWHGYSQSEINMMRIIQSAEPFYSNHGPQETQRKIPGVAFTMPEIPIVFMGNGEDTANVPRATPNPEPHEWWRFALRIATVRHEEDYLITGLYLALELAFAHAIPKTIEIPPPVPQQEPLPDDATPAQVHERARLDEKAAYAAIDHHVPASVYLERGSIMWPLPRDINIIYRCADGYLLRAPANPRELPTLNMMTNHDRQLTAALIGAAISVMTATVLYGVNITGTELEQWISQITIDVSHSLTTFMMFGFAACLDVSGTLQLITTRPIYIQVHKLLEQCGGIIPSRQAVRGRDWNLCEAALATRDPTHYYFSSSPNAPPRNGNVLAIDNVLAIRPLEWGLGGASPSVSLFKNFTCGTRFIKQWQAFSGDTTYDKIGATETPHILIPYGACAITAICQQWFIPTAARPHPTINWAGKSTYCTRGGMWHNIERPQPEWSEALGCPEPLTIMTYNWNSEDVLSIGIDATQFNESFWFQMLTSKNFKAERAGVIKYTIKDLIEDNCDDWFVSGFRPYVFFNKNSGEGDFELPRNTDHDDCNHVLCSHGSFQGCLFSYY